MKKVQQRQMECRYCRDDKISLFLLRCTEVGISIRDLDLLSIGLVLDILTTVR